MDDTTYNGWTNRATWVVNLWISNDYILYKLTQGLDVSTPERCKRFYRNVVDDKTKRAVKKDMGKGVTLRDVNWQEICEAWNEI
jgi:hypothetical protein